jgi:Flp pilus assembly protein TadG
MKTHRSESGQSLVITVIFLTVLLGMAALVVDAGSWFRQHRELQATADAAALAGAQELPLRVLDAKAAAQDFASRNTAGLANVDVDFDTSVEPFDTIRVRVEKPAPGFFARIFGLDSVDVGAAAAARTGGLQSAKYVAPIVVHVTHPMLNACGGPCLGSGYETTIPLSDTGAPGAFSLLNLLGGGTGTAGASELGDWIENGFDAELPLGGYYSAPGVKFNSHTIQQALGIRRDSDDPVMLFPVYDTLSGQGANAEYHIIGWVPFHILDFETHGNDGSITGYFTEIIWNGTLSTTTGGGGPNFGARTVQLVE